MLCCRLPQSTVQLRTAIQQDTAQAQTFNGIDKDLMILWQERRLGLTAGTMAIWVTPKRKPSDATTATSSWHRAKSFRSTLRGQTCGVTWWPSL
jgi:hypothetical protein